VDYNSQGFKEHIRFVNGGKGYILSISSGLSSSGLFKDYGILNLDSIKAAPPDSEMVEEIGDAGLYRVFNVTPDSLNSLIGTSYVIKTRDDPRRGNPFYAKIRILDFNIIDSATHTAEMVFLWLCNTNGWSLGSAGFDTFNLDTPTAVALKKQNVTLKNTRAPSVYKVVGNAFTIPQELAGKVTYAEVFDVRGRLLGRVEVGEGFIDLKRKISKAETKMTFVKLVSQ
jgi:hypothetical protein